jgi:hypothetical protein
MSDTNTSVLNQGALSYILGKTVVAQLLLVIVIGIVLYLVMMSAEILYTSWMQLSGTRVELIPYTVSSQDKPLEFEQNPTALYNKHVPMSDNEHTGSEFTYSFFLWVNANSFNNSEGLSHILHKGNSFFFPLMGPGVFMKTNTNTMRVYMNSSKSWNNYIDVENIPVKKWVHVAIVARSNALEVYVNGNLSTKLNMNGGVIYQNFGNIYCFSQRTAALQASLIPSLNQESMMVSGPFNGSLSRLNYYSYAISYTELQALVAEGPSSKTLSNPQDSPPYLQDTWWTTTYTSR